MAIDRIGGLNSGNYSSSSVQSKTPEIHVSTIPNSEAGGRTDITLSKSKDGKDGQYNRETYDPGTVRTDKDVSPEKIKAAVDDLNKQIKIKHTQCSFKYHDDTNRISITVTDSETHEVIKEIPPEKALDMLAKAWELAGLMVDEKR